MKPPAAPPRLPLLRALRPVEPKRLLRDAAAGLTLASVNVPQLLGYTRIAGTPVVTGLYTALLPAIAFAGFASSRHLVVAADSATAAIFANALAPLAPRASAHYMELVAVVALLTAVLLLIARLFRLGFLADFLSRTVLVGFLTGVGVQVAIAMLGDMLGIAYVSHHTLDQLGELLEGWRRIQPQVLALSALVAGAILAGRRWAPRAPVALVAVVGGIAASAAWDLAAHGVPTIGPVPGGLPSLAFPHTHWREALALLPTAAACAMVIIAQSAAAARAYALRYREEDDTNADLLGLSAANAAAAISGAFVVNGSPTQTAVADRAGATSQWAQLTLAATILLVLLFATGPLQYLPHGVLAAIVFTIGLGLIDLAGLREIRRESRGEATLAVVTAATVAIAGVEQGVLLAVTLSLLRHVRHSYMPHTAVLVLDAAGRAVPQPPAPGTVTEPGLIVYRFGAPLFYANDQRFAGEVRALLDGAPAPVRSVVVEASAITDLDYSAARALRELLDDLHRRGVRLIFGRVAPALRADIERHRILEALGADALFLTLHEAIEAARRPDSVTTPP